MAPEDTSHLGNGMSLVYEPSDGDAAAVIIFVHGLFGHPFKTWSAAWPRSKPSRNPKSVAPSRGSGDSQGKHLCYWPYDLLPGEIPSARIYAWGYDADIEKFMSTASLNTLYQHSSNLLNDICDLRDEPRNKTSQIIFVVHSLGGLVVKDALNKSAEFGADKEDRRGQVAEATIGVIFLGTPHKGSKAASLGRTAFRLTEIVAAQRPNTKLLQALEVGSETLERITESFYRTLDRNKDLRIFSFHEEKEVRRLGLFSTVIVPAESARIGHRNEECGSIPQDHRYMAKFSSRDDVGFVRVSKVLQRWIKDSNQALDMPKNQNYTDCIASLDEPSARARVGQVARQYERSFEWLFDNKIVPFSAWLKDDGNTLGPLFWCTGKPGSGKSTLMKFALNDPRTREYLALSDPNSWSTMSFFFHDRGSMIQKSMEGMLKELLFQFLSLFPDVYICLHGQYAAMLKSQRSRPVRWTVEDLQEAFLNIIKLERLRTAPQRNACIFIDALDEHAGNNDTLLAFLKNVSNRGKGPDSKIFAFNIKVCVASRPWPIFESEFRGSPQFAIHQHTRKDIDRYVFSRLFRAAGYQVNDIDPYHEQMASVSPEIIELANQVSLKASGVFIWVRIVIDELCPGLRDGTPVFVLTEVVSKIPEELEDLYRRALSKVQRARECYVMLQIALCALKPLSVEDFMKVSDSTLFGSAVSSEHRDSSASSQLARLASRTAGLLEAVPFSNDPMGLGQELLQTVQFIHQTVRDFVHVSSSTLFSSTAWKKSSDDSLMTLPGSLMLLAFYSHFEGGKREFVDPEHMDDPALEYASIVDELIDRGRKDLIGIFSEAVYSLFRKCVFREKSSHVSVSIDRFVIASNLYNYAHDIDREAAPYTEREALLQLAALGTRNNNRRLDRVRAVENIVGQGYERNIYKSLLPSFPHPKKPNMPVDKALSRVFTALQAVVLFKDWVSGNVDESTWLEIAKVLLESGEDPNTPFHKGSIEHNISYQDWELGPWPLVQFCLRSRDIRWTGLLLSHGAAWPLRHDEHNWLQAQRSLSGMLYRNGWAELHRNGVVMEDVVFRDSPAFQTDSVWTGLVTFEDGISQSILAAGVSLSSISSAIGLPSDSFDV